MNTFTFDFATAAKRIGIALASVAAIGVPPQIPEEEIAEFTGRCLVGQGLELLLQTGMSRDDMHAVVDQILTIYPSVSVECRRAMMRDVKDHQ